MTVHDGAGSHACADGRRGGQDALRLSALGAMLEHDRLLAIEDCRHLRFDVPVQDDAVSHGEHV